MESNKKGDMEPRKEDVTIERRPASPEDFEFARKTHHESYRDVVVKQFGSWDEKQQDDFFTTAWKGSPHEILSMDGELCGYFSMEETPDAIELHELVLLPKFQGKGIGGKLLSSTIEIAKLKNKPLHLEVLKENKAVELYRKLGFVETDETATHYKMTYDFAPSHEAPDGK